MLGGKGIKKNQSSELNDCLIVYSCSLVFVIQSNSYFLRIKGKVSDKYMIFILNSVKSEVLMCHPNP